MKFRYVIVPALVAACAVVGCKKLRVQDIAGTVWENRSVVADPQMGSEELTLTIEFNYDMSVNLKRTERWIKKRTKLDLEPPKDEAVSGNYRIADNVIQLVWSDGGTMDFLYRDGEIVTADGGRVFKKANRKIPLKY